MAPTERGLPKRSAKSEKTSARPSVNCTSGAWAEGRARSVADEVTGPILPRQGRYSIYFEKYKGEDAEEKAGHGRGMMKEDVLPAADRSRLRGRGRGD